VLKTHQKLKVKSKQESSINPTTSDNHRHTTSIRSDHNKPNTCSEDSRHRCRHFRHCGRNLSADGGLRSSSLFLQCAKCFLEDKLGNDKYSHSEDTWVALKKGHRRLALAESVLSVGLWPNSRSQHKCEHNTSLGFSFVFLFSLAVTFLHFCSGNFSITTARNARVGYSLCLCVMEYRNHAARWMVEEGAALKMVWWKGREKQI